MIFSLCESDIARGAVIFALCASDMPQAAWKGAEKCEEAVDGLIMRGTVPRPRATRCVAVIFSLCESDIARGAVIFALCASDMPQAAWKGAEKCEEVVDGLIMREPSRDPHPSPDIRSRMSPPRVSEGEKRRLFSNKVG